MVGGLVHRQLSLGFGWPSTIDPALATGGSHPLPPFPFSFFSFLLLPPLLLLPPATIFLIVARPTKGGRPATSFPPQPIRVAELPWPMPSRHSMRPREEWLNTAPLLSPFPLSFPWAAARPASSDRPNPTRRRPGASEGRRPWLGLGEPASTPPSPNQGESRFNSRFYGGPPSGPLPFPSWPSRAAGLLPPSAPIHSASSGTWSDQGRGAAKCLPRSLSFSLLIGWRFDLVDGVRR